jgi:predicted DNA-binding transcriptional regulator AlpA
MFRNPDTNHMTSTGPAVELLNENQVAQRLGVSIATVRRWRSLKVGPRFRKIGGASVRYANDDLTTWVESQPSGGETKLP